MADAPASVATHPNQQRGGSASERLVREAAGHRVARHALGAVLPAPRIGLNNPTLDHGTVALESLPDGLKAELIEAAERGQVRVRECSVKHVEVFQMGSVGTSILEDLDAYPASAARTLATPSITKSPFSHNPPSEA